MCLRPYASEAGTGAITGTKAGPTPFISNISATYSGGTLEWVSYQITPKPGSFTRPLTVDYTPQYLTSQGDLQGSSLTIPVFGLYPAYTNSVSVTFYFTDGTVNTQPVNITTPAYTDPCAALNTPSLSQSRTSTSSLGFDYFLLKDACGGSDPNTPLILDTDGNIRWSASPGWTATASAIYNNGIYLTNGGTGIVRMDLTNPVPVTLGNYSAAPYNVTFTGHHNIDHGRNGLIVDVNTTTELEAVDLEFDPNTGAVLNYWDLGQIISYTMQAGGETAATIKNFVTGTSTDWFHNNATAYNPADNTLIVSSRENFVVAVDYDTPSDGQKKIHWILGDTTKAWYQNFQSLRKFALTLGSNTLPPIGQHAVSIDHNGNLLLFDDGQNSLNHTPAGNQRTYSAVREYQINTAAKTATTGSIYYSPNPSVFNQFCGSVYDVNGTYLVDFPDLGGAYGLSLQGLGTTDNVVFNFQYGIGGCAGGWNAYPIPSNVFQFGAEPAVSLTPTIISFPNQIPGNQSGYRTVILTNFGNGPLSIGAIQLTGGSVALEQFTIGTDTCSGSTVGAGATCSVSVAFAPQGVGTFVANLVFNDNAGGVSSMQTVTLNGKCSCPTGVCQ